MQGLSSIRTYPTRAWSRLGTAGAGVGLLGFLGTNTGAFTACAGRAALGVGDSGGLRNRLYATASGDGHTPYGGEEDSGYDG